MFLFVTPLLNSTSTMSSCIGATTCKTFLSSLVWVSKLNDQTKSPTLISSIKMCPFSVDIFVPFTKQQNPDQVHLLCNNTLPTVFLVISFVVVPATKTSVGSMSNITILPEYQTFSLFVIGNIRFLVVITESFKFVSYAVSKTILPLIELLINNTSLLPNKDEPLTSPFPNSIFVNHP